MKRDRQGPSAKKTCPRIYIPTRLCVFFTCRTRIESVQYSNSEQKCSVAFFLLLRETTSRDSIPALKSKPKESKRNQKQNATSAMLSPEPKIHLLVVWSLLHPELAKYRAHLKTRIDGLG